MHACMQLEGINSSLSRPKSQKKSCMKWRWPKKAPSTLAQEDQIVFKIYSRKICQGFMQGLERHTSASPKWQYTRSPSEERSVKHTGASTRKTLPGKNEDREHRRPTRSEIPAFIHCALLTCSVVQN
jgi:hypothetical protein